MRLLLDSHAFLWFVWDAPQMPETIKALIEEEGHEKFLSVASAWELAIKVGIGKLALTQPINTFLPNLLQRNGIQLLPISLDHALYVATLPFHHRDPFDRLIVAQSLLEEMPIVSGDSVLDSYGVQRYW